MGAEEQPSSDTDRPITWEEIKKHSTRTDKWLVIDRDVFDISQWCKRHPGGLAVISHYAGQDATEPFRAFHNDPKYVGKYLKAIKIGRLADEEVVHHRDMKEDFEKLRQTAKDMGLFKPSILFYICIVGHLLALDAASYYILSYWGTGWIPYILALICTVAMQAEAGWSQHDFGHLSVFKSSWMNHVLHQFTMCFMKGASCDWWNHLHYQHHSKPNVLYKDPDVRLDALFVLGETMPKRKAEKKTRIPFNWQHRYFFVIGPPLLFPIYFQIMIFRHPIKRRKYIDLFIMCLYYLKFFYLYSSLMGGWGALQFYFLMRVIESHWFVWVTQSNHIPMEIDDDKERPWLPLQLHATCNVEKGFFNDWFTGHLNFQVEHHLFPTMPRHNLYKIQPLVKELCRKHDVPYQVKPISNAFADIVKSLEHSGQIWEAYYHAYHLS